MPVKYNESAVKRQLAPPLKHQQKVDDYFQSQSSYWRDIYASHGVWGEILRERQATVLQWIDRLASQRALTPAFASAFGSVLAPAPATASTRTPGFGSYPPDALEIACGAGVLAIALARRGL